MNLTKGKKVRQESLSWLLPCARPCVQALDEVAHVEKDTECCSYTRSGVPCAALDQTW